MQQRIAGVVAGTFLLAGGWIHLDLWQNGYRAIDYIGPLFVANVVVSALLVLAVMVRPRVDVALAGVVFAVGSLVALVLSRTTGLLGFVERDWTDMAIQATTAEIGTVVALALMIVVRMRSVPTPVPATVSARGRRRR